MEPSVDFLDLVSIFSSVAASRSQSIAIPKSCRRFHGNDVLIYLRDD